MLQAHEMDLENNQVSTMTYSEEQLRTLCDEYAAARLKSTDLMASYTFHEFNNERAREFARHGFSRRLQLMTRCMVNVFETLPPNTTVNPDSDEIHDATISLQAFIFNTFGCVDNLAHIWVNEKEVRRESGNPLPNSCIGFGANNKVVRKSLPKRVSDVLTKFEPWFKYLGNYRHALAHRIPLYIPPGTVWEENAPEYQEIDAQIQDAVRGGNYAEAERLTDERDGLMSFVPITMHSFGENARQVYFHFQMLSDFNTVEEIAQTLFREFD